MERFHLGAILSRTDVEAAQTETEEQSSDEISEVKIGDLSGDTYSRGQKTKNGDCPRKTGPSAQRSPYFIVCLTDLIKWSHEETALCQREETERNSRFIGEKSSRSVTIVTDSELKLAGFLKGSERENQEFNSLKPLSYLGPRKLLCWPACIFWCSISNIWDGGCHFCSIFIWQQLEMKSFLWNFALNMLISANWLHLQHVFVFPLVDGGSLCCVCCIHLDDKKKKWRSRSQLCSHTACGFKSNMCLHCQSQSTMQTAWASASVLGNMECFHVLEMKSLFV